MSHTPKKISPAERSGSSPAGRGGAGTYIEGQIGAYYLLQMLADSEARGLPEARIEQLQLQGQDAGYALDDLIVHGVSDKGTAILEIQSKRTIYFSPQDSIFKNVCKQIAHSNPAEKPTDRHLFAVATQRTSRSISGPYQDTLEWARKAKSGKQFFERLALKGVASKEMRSFAATFRANLVANGAADDDEVIWDIIRRFLILEFDFESSAPESKAHALTLARQILAPEDATRAEALWGNLIEIVIEAGKVGASITRAELIKKLKERDFQLAGDRNFKLARAKLAEMSRHALMEITTTVGNVHLPRLNVLTDLEKARDKHRFIEIVGEPGVGKSGVLRHLAERTGREGHVIVLDPINTPDGGWGALAQRLEIHGTAKDFLWDLATSGGGILFIDGLEMFTSAERRRTVNDLLREIAKIPGFSVIVSRRPDSDLIDTGWIAEDALAKLGTPRQVVVKELDDEEVAALRTDAPELHALLSPDHPAANIARNLYRLAQLLKAPKTANLRTEAELANHWWKSADGANPEDIRPAQRLLAELAEAALAGRDCTTVTTDTSARAHLLSRQTLSEPRRDQLVFHHDVLRDWAIGAHLNEDITLLDRVDLSAPPSPQVARGIEFAGRFALEQGQDATDWMTLLDALSRPGAHPAWRRQALMAIVHSELSTQLLNRYRAALLADEGALLIEICKAIIATETESAASFFRKIAKEGAEHPEEAAGSLRVATSGSASVVLRWCAAHADEIPIPAIPEIVKLAETLLVFARLPEIGKPLAKMLFDWLMQLDWHGTVPKPANLVRNLRYAALLAASCAPDEAKAYLNAVAEEKDHFKVKEIRPFSKILASVAPSELSAIVKASLIEEQRGGRSRRDTPYGAFGFADADYMPASPAQPPFLDLLDANPEIGLDLIRTLVDAAVEHYAEDKEAGTNGFTVVIDGKPRFFPWVETYFWSRSTSIQYGWPRENAVASALMALEAWSHERLERGEEINAVLQDILGPEGTCAAYLCIALDVLLSHWPGTREALVPFVANPALLAMDRIRAGLERLGGGMMLKPEPKGRVMLADLARRPSRSIMLEQLIPYYLSKDDAGQTVRSLLTAAVKEIGPYGADADFGDPAFMGSYTLNMLDHANWVEVDDSRLEYKPPPAEAEHLKRLEARKKAHEQPFTLEMRIMRAISDPAKGSPELAREAVEHAAGDLPDYSDTDYLKSRTMRLISTALLVARDGDDGLLDEHEGWVRVVIAKAMEEEADSFGAKMLDYNRPAQGICAMIHLWCRKQLVEDRNLLLQTIARQERAAVIAFAAARDRINEIDPRLIKAAIRIAFTCCRWQRHPHDEDATAREARNREKARKDAEAVAAEIAWLDGGPEPPWPELPEEMPPSSRMPHAMLSPDGSSVEIKGDENFFRDNPREPMVRVNHQALAQWLWLLTGENGTLPGWYGEIVNAYASWSARLNGYGAKINQTPHDWNDRFYSLVGSALMDATEDRFEALLKPIIELPDQSFCNVAATLILTADGRYFYEANRSSDRVSTLRQRLVSRTMALHSWAWSHRRGELSIDLETGPLINALLMNTHNFTHTKSYLVPDVFDRVDPLLETVRPMMPGGPTAFVAFCTMNTLNVAPTARHLDFLLFAVEAWLDAANSEGAMWHELGIGRMIAEWFEAAAVGDPSLYSQSHPLRSRIDAILGRLVSLGVPEAHELELRIQEEMKRHNA